MKRHYVLAAGVFLLTCSFIPQSKDRKPKTPAGQEDSIVKVKAFGVLNTKCNFCHHTQNPKKVFTRDNMDDYADNIYRQVFVWHRMPKNNAVTLSSEEEGTLKRWLRVHTKVKD